MRLLPRDERFFDLFDEVAKRNVEAAKQLRDVLAADVDHRLPLVESIKRLEHEADDLTHEVVTRLDRTFITPAASGTSPYWVRITNPCGSVDSNTVTVTSP